MPVTLPSLVSLKKRIQRECDIKIHRMGAICFLRNGHVLATACNRKGNGYVSEYSYHCEEMVLERSAYARKRAKSQAYILVVRPLARGEYGLAKPCQGCYELCKEAGVKIFYTTIEGIKEL